MIIISTYQARVDLQLGLVTGAMYRWENQEPLNDLLRAIGTAHQKLFITSYDELGGNEYKIVFGVDKIEEIRIYDLMAVFTA